jgi:Mrp family chromosome partitioning ATPase
MSFTQSDGPGADYLGALAAIEALPRRGGGGRVIGVISASAGEGGSTVARELALAHAEATERATLLVDLDGLRDGQHRWFDDAAPLTGLKLGPVQDGRLQEASFLSFTDADGAPLDAALRLLAMRRVGPLPLFVTHVRTNAAPDGARVAVDPAPDYWQGARASASLTVVDAPSLARTRAVFAAASHFDGVILVVSAQTGAAAATLKAKREFAARGVRVIGLIYTDADPALLRLQKLSVR